LVDGRFGKKMTASEPQQKASTLSMTEKESALRAEIRNLGSVLIAYSGGVDSSYLAWLASDTLGDSAVCVLGVSASVPSGQRENAARIAKDFGFNFMLVDTEEMSDPNYVSNPVNRCFFCKSELYSKLSGIASSIGSAAILDGTNADDMNDFRPGREAAEKAGVRSLLAEFGMSKTEIRELARKAGLPNWDAPASPCLSSRISHGVPVTMERLSNIENAEVFLRNRGFREFRVRVHGDLARVEIARQEMDRALNADFAADLSRELKKTGFKFVTLDLEGFRSGSMNPISM
jgi:uncharacterized protein